MPGVPENPKIYHITHLQNLAQIIETGKLWSDAKRIELGLNCEIVGMSAIKKRRLEDLPVKCHPATMVGEYVPFYFCPRSIMLFILDMGNHIDVTYRGGQARIIHLEADLKETVEWANSRERQWAFSDCNAGAHYAMFFNTLGKLNKINWEAVEATDFRHPAVKEGKQAEFLIFKSFPWKLIDRIGVINTAIQEQVGNILSSATHKPIVSIERTWYF